METGIRAGLTTPAELRRFGLTSGSSIALVLGIIVPLLKSVRPPVWPFVIGLVLAGTALIAPRTLRPLHKFGTFVVGAVRTIVTFVMVSFLFIVVITPTALILRLTKRDPLSRRAAETKSSYRIPAVATSADRLERPF